MSSCVLFDTFNVFKYITFRTIYSTLTALAISFILGPWFIKTLAGRQIAERVRKDGPESHIEKEGTPTMGGSLILFSLVLPTLLWADLTNKFMWVVVFVTLGFGIIGYVDDRYKMTSEDAQGMKARNKFVWP